MQRDMFTMPMQRDICSQSRNASKVSVHAANISSISQAGGARTKRLEHGKDPDTGRRRILRAARTQAGGACTAQPGHRQDVHFKRMSSYCCLVGG